MRNQKAPQVINDKARAVASITKTRAKGRNKNGVELDYGNATTVAKSISDSMRSNEEILELFPDTELPIQILVSSVLSPTDMLNTRLMYSMDAIDIPNNVNTLILAELSRYIEANYNLTDKLSNMLREAMFTKGAYIEVMIPGANVLDLVNKYERSVSTESIITDMSTTTALGASSELTMSLETITSNVPDKTSLSFKDSDLSVEFIENVGVLRAPKIAMDCLATESKSIGSNTNKLMRALRTKKVDKDAVYAITPNNDDGSPYVMKLPVESVLPIHLTSDPSTHIGYFVMLDKNGVPITGKLAKEYDNSQIGDIGAVDTKASIISKAANALKGKTSKSVTLADGNDIYTTALVASIKDKLDKGKFNKLATVSDDNEIYSILYRRSVEGLGTKMLYVPRENMSYIAFEYRENGTGRSLIEKAAMLYSIRAANLFTRMLANIKNSVTTTKITADIDEKDPDPESTKELIINEAMKSERAKYPIGMTNVRDWVNWMHNVGYRFEINNPGLPDIKIDISEDTRNVAIPDDSLDESIQEHIYMTFGLNRDMVASGESADFATTIVANNALFAKRVMDVQNKFNPQLSIYIRNVLKNDSVIKDKICDIINSNIKDIRKLLKKSLSNEAITDLGTILDNDSELTEAIYLSYADAVSVKLPKIETSVEEGSLEALSAFSDMLDTYLPMYISAETLPNELVGDLSDKMDDVMAAIKTVLIKNWMDEHNMLPELTKFFTLDNTGAPKYNIMDEYKEYIDSVTKVILPHLKKLKKSSVKTDDELNKIEDIELGDESTPEDTPPSGDDTPPEDDVNISDI